MYKLDETYELEEIRKRDAKRKCQIELLQATLERPTVLPSTKTWIKNQIELIKSGGAAD